MVFQALLNHALQLFLVFLNLSVDLENADGVNPSEDEPLEDLRENGNLIVRAGVVVEHNHHIIQGLLEKVLEDLGKGVLAADLLSEQKLPQIASQSVKGCLNLLLQGHKVLQQEETNQVDKSNHF